MNAPDEPTVLVVEDEVDLADLYAEWLRADGCHVRTAYDGTEALDALGEAIDIVLLDRRMPGLSGDEVLEAVVDEGYSCRVAMVTAIEPDFDIIDMGFDDYLIKPVSRDDLQATIDRLVTRATYDTQLEQYAALVSKKSTLEAEKSESELDGNPKFAALEAEIEELQASVDTMVQEFDDRDVAAMLRDLPATSEP